jgi:hypothetical protein
MRSDKIERRKLLDNQMPSDEHEPTRTNRRKRSVNEDQEVGASL